MSTIVSAPTDGISHEVQALIKYCQDSPVESRITCTYNHSTNTAAGYPSRHVAVGTGGRGLAIDIATVQPSSDSQGLADIFNRFLPEQHNIHELIYAGPQTSFNIKSGKRVAKYAQSGHHNHVHLSVDKGILLRYSPVGDLVANYPIDDGMVDCWPEHNPVYAVGTNHKGQVFLISKDPKYHDVGAYDRLPADQRKGTRVCKGVKASEKGYTLIFDDLNTYNWNF